MNTAAIVFINYSDSPSKCRIKPQRLSTEHKTWHEEFSGQDVELNYEQIREGIEITLQPFESKIFTYTM